MAETTIGGRKINIETSEVSVGDWRKFWGNKMSDAEEDALIEKMTALKTKDIESMTRLDFSLLMRAIATSPVTQPDENSPS